jgi:c-di-GMP-binding flagellar brake protein YcgR
MSVSHYKAVRKFVRYSLDVRAKLITSEGEIRVRTLDISEGGIGLVSPTAIPDGSTFVIELEFPTSLEVFRAEVCARSIVGFRLGFSFVSVGEESMALLKRYQRRTGILAKENYAARS